MQDQWFHADSRLLAAIRFRFLTVEDEYTALRACLAESAWNTVDVCRRWGLYCEAMTFPGWTEPDQMLDFGWLHEHYPLGGYSTLCIRIKGSPIADSLEITIDRLLGQTKIDLVELKRILSVSVAANPRISKSDLLLNGDLAKDEFAAFENSPIAACLRDIVEQPFVVDAALVFSQNWSAEVFEEMSSDQAILRLWLGILLDPEKEMAIKIT